MEEEQVRPSVNRFLNSSCIRQADWIRLKPEFNRDTMEKFFSSRVVYYPGSGTDGRAIAIFNSSKSAYCFVHIDFSCSAHQVMQELNPDHPNHINGYAPLFHTEITPKELQELLNLDQQHPVDGQEPRLNSALWTILQKEPGKSTRQGFEYIALLHIQAKAVWVCWNLWMKSKTNPFAMILQDHGFSGNYAPFGGSDAPLYRVAQQTKNPDNLLVAKGTPEWPNYQAVSEWTHRVNGNQNRLFRRME